MDLSFGNYTIKKAILNSCEDKGISLGETSNGNFDNINIFDTKLGIVVKDSSKAHVNNLYSKNIKEFCLSAYKKKQEFDGGIISYKNLYCNKNSYFDKFSKVYQQK